MEEKGFTLIELMAVVAILVVLSLIVVPIVDKHIKKSKDEMYNIQIENIRMAGEMFFSDNILSRPGMGDYCSISMEQLASNGYIAENIVNPKTGSNFSDLYVQIKNTGVNNDRFSYFVCPIESDCESLNKNCG